MRLCLGFEQVLLIPHLTDWLTLRHAKIYGSDPADPCYDPSVVEGLKTPDPTPDGPRSLTPVAPGLLTRPNASGLGQAGIFDNLSPHSAAPTLNLRAGSIPSRDARP
jgi:hypothetical protein